MPRLAVLAALVALAPATAGATPLAIPVQSNTLNFTAGAWRGGPVTDQSGQIQACAMFASAGGGMQLFFRLSAAFDFSLGLVNRGWTLGDGAMVAMTYRIDNSAPVDVQARATRSDTILIDIADRESIFQSFRRGLWLHLSTQGANGRFSLKGSSVALERLRSCATTIAAAAPQAPPQPPPQQPQAVK